MDLVTRPVCTSPLGATGPLTGAMFVTTLAKS